MSARPKMSLPPSDLDCIPQEEAIRRLGVSRQTFWRWRREGRVRCIEKFGRVQVNVASLRRLMEA